MGVRKVSSLLIRSVLGGPGNRYFDWFILSLPLVTFTVDRKRFNHKELLEENENLLIIGLRFLSAFGLAYDSVV